MLTATSGATTANLSGYARITFNEPGSYTDDRFSYFAAPIGALVPFSVTYTLAAGRTWTATTMNSSFSYNLAGTLDFTRAIAPEPSSIASIGIAAVGLLARRRR